MLTNDAIYSFQNGRMYVERSTGTEWFRFQWTIERMHRMDCAKNVKYVFRLALERWQSVDKKTKLSRKPSPLSVATDVRCPHNLFRFGMPAIDELSCVEPNGENFKCVSKWLEHIC